MSTKILFSQLPISEEMQRAIADMGFTEASPIQAEAIPIALSGRDVMGMAQTGTGKTAAFGIPALEIVEPNQKNVQVLVLCPTRELALQVTDEFEKLSKYKKIKCVTVYGGDPIDRQIRALKAGAQIVIGTPGRIIDHLERGTLKLDNVKIAILDEADEMLDMGFREDIEGILEELPFDRQTLLFSATMSKSIMAIIQKFQNDPAVVKVVRKELTAENIEQLYYEIKGSAKLEVMCRLIDFYNLQLMLVFCNTKKKVDEVTAELIERGYKAEAIHGDLNQRQREKVMKQFRDGSVTILVATDVAARGIDVTGVDAVFNYDIPLDPEYYVHRIGRTGRAGNSGKAFTFIVGREFVRLKEIQDYTKKKIERGVIPSIEDLIGIKNAQFVENVVHIAQNENIDSYEELLTQLRHAGLKDEAIIKALIQLHWQHKKTEYVDMDVKEMTSSEKDFGRDGKDRKGKKREQERGSSSRFGEKSSSRGSRGGKMVRLFLNVGKMDRVRPNDIVGAFTGETGIAFGNIGQIDILDKFSFVEIAEADVQKVMKGMKNNTIKGKSVNIEIAK
ncbi:MAG: DEAD/DEAH box helicase [Thermonemataceae bacterium]|nr:DEAD/DEAH box helicase [Thermonemataceae bacterium]